MQSTSLCGILQDTVFAFQAVDCKFGVYDGSVKGVNIMANRWSASAERRSGSASSRACRRSRSSTASRSSASSS